MINANELRIGNWVKGPIGKNDFEIINVSSINDWIGINGGSDNVSYGWSKFEDLEPIHITSDILEQLGFSILVLNNNYGTAVLGMPENLKGIHVDRGKSLCYIKKSVTLYHVKDEGLMFIHGTGAHCAGTLVKGLHKLQNLYFSLSGEELEFNNPNIYGFLHSQENNSK